MSIDYSADSYNKFTDYPLFSYNCVSHLVQDTSIELLWKLLYYNDKDAWREDVDHPNLTRAQKGALIYDGSINETDFRVFLDTGISDPWTVESSQIRVSPILLEPTNYIIGKIIMALEIYSHFKVNTLSSYQTRTDTIAQLLISSLNGSNINGIGKLYFDRRASRQCGIKAMGSIPFRGKIILMGNNIT